MTTTEPYKTLLDGEPATAAQLAPLAFAGFAHFTAMQVRQGAVRGLDLHLQRLRTASERLFGRAAPDDTVRAQLRAAVAGGPEEASLTATMFSRSGEFTPVGGRNDPALLVRAAPAAQGPRGPLRLDAVRHMRPLPEIKHVGEVTKTFYLRQAVERGFDDAAYVDDRACLSEATIWNLVFWDGSHVVWPQAEMLNGITMQIVRRQFERLGVAQCEQPVRLDDVRRFSGAAVMNSWTPGVAVGAIQAVTLPVSEGLMALLHQAYRLEPEIPIAT